jgi:lambda family phage tail tape measure protein
MPDQEVAVVLRLIADQFQREVRKSQGIFGDFASVIRSWQVQFAAVAGTLFAIAKSTGAHAEQLLKQAEAFGTSTEKMSGYQFAAKLANVSNDQLSTSFGFLLKQAVAAAQGQREAADAFSNLGVSVTDANGQLKSTDTLVQEVSDRLRGMPEGPQRIALAMQLMGKSAKETLAFFTSDLRAADAEARRVGITMSTEDAKAAAEFDDSLDKLNLSLGGLKNRIGVEVIPILDLFVRGATSATAATSGWMDKLREFAADSKVQDFLANMRGFLFPGTGAAGAGAPGASLKSGLLAPPGTAFPPPPPGAGLPPPPPEKGKRQWYEEHIEEFRKYQKEQLALYIQGLTSMGEQLKAFQAQTGDAMVEEFRLRQRYQQRDLQGEVALAQAKLQAAESGLAPIEELAARRRAVLEAQQAQELASTELTETQRLAIVTKYTAEIEEQRRIEVGGFLEGWRIGLNRYINDYGNMLGLAVDLSRRTAQLMETGFRTYFFDVMDGKIKSFKDLLRGVLDFVKQIVAQVAAQLATAGIVRWLGTLGSPGIVEGLGGLRSGGGSQAAHLQHGGRWTVQGPGGPDSQLVRFMATPGEEITVRTPEQQQRGSFWPFTINNDLEVHTTVRNETPSGVEVGQPRIDGNRLLLEFVIKAVRQGLGEGALDRDFQMHFGMRRLGSAR